MVYIASYVYTLGLSTNLPTALQFISTHDKWTHFTIFTVETFLFISIFPKQTKYITLWGQDAVNLDHEVESQIYRKVNKLVLTFIVCVVCGSIGSEFLQYLATRGVRNFDPLDMMVNIMGSGLGMLIFYYLDRRSI